MKETSTAAPAHDPAPGAAHDAGATPIIEAQNIVKRFGGAVAVDDVSIAVPPGQIHGLVGENGAGKSTLMRVLAGILIPDNGVVMVDGQPLDGGTRAALEAGIALVHQELSLVPELTVAENILLGSTPTKAGFINTGLQRQIAADAMEEIGVSVDLDQPVARLSVALRQFVEIARAVARNPRVLILDEPTATLTPAETDYLLDMLQRLAERGLAIIYISHRIPEIFRICDRVTVLRDGKRVDSVAISETAPDRLVDMMVGRELMLGQRAAAAAGSAATDTADVDQDQSGPEDSVAEIVLRAEGIVANRVHGVDLEVRAGEIVGLGGLVGAGRTELVRAIIGADIRTAGRVTMMVDGTHKRINGYRSAIASGLAYVPEERRADGLALSMSVSDNITLPNRGHLSSGGFLIRRKIAGFARDLANVVGLRPPEIQREAGEYSGGNQQKVVLAKWLGRRPAAIVLDEPTRGVDVGAKAEIHRLIRGLAETGTAVLVVSSDLPELLELSDVIHVVRDGRIVGTLGAEQADEVSVMSLAAGEASVGAGS